MMKIASALPAFLALLAFLPAARGSGTADSGPDLRAGFYLLHYNCQQEAQASLILLFKTTPPDTADYLKRIAALAKESVKTLDRLAAVDASLQNAPDPLPPFEQAARKSIAKDKQHLLLFGSKGKTFSRRMLFTQIEACNYLYHLCKVWAERDPDAGGARTMDRLGERWEKLRDEGFRLLDESG